MSKAHGEKSIGEHQCGTSDRSWKSGAIGQLAGGERLSATICGNRHRGRSLLCAGRIGTPASLPRRKRTHAGALPSSCRRACKAACPISALPTAAGCRSMRPISPSGFTSISFRRRRASLYQPGVEHHGATAIKPLQAQPAPHRHHQRDALALGPSRHRRYQQPPFRPNLVLDTEAMTGLPEKEWLGSGCN